MKVKIGIVGVGNIGTRHLTSILNGNIGNVEITAAADRKEERRQWIDECAKGQIRLFAEGSDLISSGFCDAVLIATPHYEHPILAMEAFSQGLHVLCEKPAGVYTKIVRQMNKEAQKSGNVFALMFNQRTDPAYRKMYEMVHSGILGKIKRVNWLITDWYRSQIYYDSGNWRATWEGEGGGVLLNQCPHNLDLIQWICGMPKSVQAFCHEGKWHNIEVEDDVTAYLEYPGGATGVFITTTADMPGTNRFEITFEKGKLVYEDGRLMLHRLEMSEREYCFAATEGFEKLPCNIEEIAISGENTQHDGIISNFADAILHHAPLIAEGEEGILGLTLSNAMHLSSWLNCKVTLPLDEKLFLEELNKKRAGSRIKTGTEIYMDTSGSYGTGLT